MRRGERLQPRLGRRAADLRQRFDQLGEPLLLLRRERQIDGTGSAGRRRRHGKIVPFTADSTP
jgi:hypothetical protein